VRAYLDTVRVERGCRSCGYRENAAALHFDHIVPLHQLGWVKRKKKWTGPKTFKEANALVLDPNVQVLCANCHAIKTRLNGDYRKP
jgi:5-methylcytosine-specific restriction endonuclease McrA